MTIECSASQAQRPRHRHWHVAGLDHNASSGFVGFGALAIGVMRVWCVSGHSNIKRNCISMTLWTSSGTRVCDNWYFATA